MAGDKTKRCPALSPYSSLTFRRLGVLALLPSFTSHGDMVLILSIGLFIGRLEQLLLFTLKPDARSCIS